MNIHANAPHGQAPGRPDGAPRPEATQRLLRQLRKALRHDLGNQLVAAVALLQLLEQEEASRLTEEGLDYVRKAVAVARRAQDLTATLAELAAVGDAADPTEPVSLRELLRELASEASVRHPGCAVECHLVDDAAATHAPRRLLYQGLGRLLRWLLPADAGPRSVTFRSRRTLRGIELLLTDAPDADWSEAVGPADEPAEEAPPGPGRPADWLLGQELLAAAGGALGLRAAPGLGRIITLALPAGRGA